MGLKNHKKTKLDLVLTALLEVFEKDLNHLTQITLSTGVGHDVSKNLPFQNILNKIESQYLEWFLLTRTKYLTTVYFIRKENSHCQIK